MIGRRHPTGQDIETDKPLGFDDFELRLGDVMRGERATMGKSLLDVQRELRIKAAYIAAIEDCDPDAFDTPGFIAGYVRSYARYLNMDPDRAFETFCAESGFQVAHGMAAEASVVRKPAREKVVRRDQSDMFTSPSTPFVPTGEALLSRIEPGAVGSMVVLLTLIGAIGYGGWTVLKEVQRVQMAPVDQTPVVLSEIDPLAGAVAQGATTTVDHDVTSPGASFGAERQDQFATAQTALDRLYRPQALEVPVLTSRDAPIATLDPSATGAFAQPSLPEPPSRGSVSAEQVALLPRDAGSGEGAAAPERAVPQVVEDLGPTIRLVATETAWVRVRSAEGSTLF